MRFRIIGEDEKLKEEMLEAIKRRHHHDDGSEATIEPINDSKSIERKVIEEENLWKLQTRQNRGEVKQVAGSSEARQALPKQNSGNEAPQARRPQNAIMAGCSCGKTFSAEKEEGAAIRITAFDRAGNVSGSYPVAGDSSASYGVSGQKGESYSASGSMRENYA